MNEERKEEETREEPKREITWIEKGARFSPPPDRDDNPPAPMPDSDQEPKNEDNN